ncbi:MAG TPA: hypothetical protein VFH73_27405 [Polyangia bacterium]|nr:hypothetical protein [Polyangia bacterium]
MSIKTALNLDPALLQRLVPATRLQQIRGCCASGVAALDHLLGGGWPRGALGELVGRRSSGRTAILHATLATAINAGETVALIDSGGALDPRSAAQSGITLSHLLWVRCPAEHTLKAADLVTAAGGFGLVALDLGEGRARIPSAAWNRLKHAAERQRAAVIVATPWQTVGAFAATAVTLESHGARFARVSEGRLCRPELIVGGAGPSQGPASSDSLPLLLALESKAARGRGRWQGEGEDPRCAWLAFSYRS